MWAMASSFLMRFLDHTQRRITGGKTPLDEWSARRRDLYLATHNTHNRQTSMPPAGYEHTISAGELRQTYALDRAATGTGEYNEYMALFFEMCYSALVINYWIIIFLMTIFVVVLEDFLIANRLTGNLLTKHFTTICLRKTLHQEIV